MDKWKHESQYWTFLNWPSYMLHQKISGKRDKKIDYLQGGVVMWNFVGIKVHHCRSPVCEWKKT